MDQDHKSMNFSEKKQVLRHAMRSRRKALPHAARQDATSKIATHLLSFMRSKPISRIAGYCAMGSEVDVMPALARLEQAGHRLALPCVTGDGLVFRRYRINDPLQTGPLKTSEPLSTEPVCQPTFILVPLLGFDAQLMRLGQGAGFYDRALAAMRQSGPVTAIGIGFSCQRSDQPIPAEPHDQPLDFVVTQEGFFSQAGLQESDGS